MPGWIALTRMPRRPELDRQRLGEADHRPFRGGIGRAQREAQPAGGGGQVDDAGIVALGQMRHGQAGAVELAGDVDRQRPVPFSGSISSTRPVGPAMPTLLTRQSSPPSAASASSNSRATAARSDMSAAVALIAGLSAASDSSPARSTSQTCTRAPSSTKARTISRPMPDAPAVTRTRRPLMPRSMAFSSLLVAGNPIPAGHHNQAGLGCRSRSGPGPRFVGPLA